MLAKKGMAAAARLGDKHSNQAESCLLMWSLTSGKNGTCAAELDSPAKLSCGGWPQPSSSGCPRGSLCCSQGPGRTGHRLKITSCLKSDESSSTAKYPGQTCSSDQGNWLWGEEGLSLRPGVRVCLLSR